MSALGFIGNYFFYNQKLTKGSDLLKMDVDVAVYEVVRIIGGIPLFYEDHLLRLHNSVKVARMNKLSLSETDFVDKVEQLCAANNSYFGNIEFRISRLKQGDTILLMGFIPHTYPTPKDYLEGISTALMTAERQNPSAKIKYSQTRLKSNAFIKEKGVFETLLVNSEGFITEGSRSNLFFIKGNTVYYTPKAYILSGITQANILNVLQKQDITLSEKLIHKNELDSMDAAFICGTSPGVLPIKSIDTLEFDVYNSILRTTMLDFNARVQHYLTNFKS